MTYCIPCEEFAQDQMTEKRSRFIGRLWHVESAEQAMDTLRSVREKEREATHHCYAYMVRQGNQMRYSDDGEPQGTAGLPILNVLQHSGLTDTLIIVTRYFGGILLGKGGLVRAYTQGAQIAIAAAGIQQMDLYDVMLIACPYNLLDSILKILPEHDGTVEQTEYGADVTLTVSLPAGGEERLATALAEASAGQVYPMLVESKFMGRRIK